MTVKQMEKYGSVVETLKAGKWFYLNPNESTVTICTKERGGGWDGYQLRLKFLLGTGYYFDLTQVWVDNEFIRAEQGDITANKYAAAKHLGGCPKCGGVLLNEFNDHLHNVEACGTPRKAIITNAIG